MIQTPEDNTFTRQSEFIDRDHRKNRPTDLGTSGKPYTVTTEFMFNRHRVMLPPELIKGKTILDVGSCYGTTGAWCLDNGATHYVGLEPQHKFVVDSNQMLGERYSKDRYSIVESALEDFKPYRKFDIVVASGVIHGYLDPFRCISTLVEIANESVIIDSQHPYNGFRSLYPNATVEQRKYAADVMNLIQLVENKPAMVDADSESSIVYNSSFPSLLSLKVIFNSNGWAYDSSLYATAECEIPEHYSLEHGRRFMAKFYPSYVSAPYFAQALKNPNSEKVSWHGNSTSK
jgi:hypothetical protein